MRGASDQGSVRVRKHACVKAWVNASVRARKRGENVRGCECEKGYYVKWFVRPCVCAYARAW
jgi:hypothetical protein